MMRLALCFAIAAASPAFAEEDAVVAAWYAALAASDAETIAALLDDGAVIELNDLGIVQSKAEFIAALDEWETAIDGADIRHRMDGVEDGMIAVTVCYDFSENQLLTRELFAIAAGRIERSVQSSLAEDCGGL